MIIDLTRTSFPYLHKEKQMYRYNFALFEFAMDYNLYHSNVSIAMTYGVVIQALGLSPTMLSQLAS